MHIQAGVPCAVNPRTPQLVCMSLKKFHSRNIIYQPHNETFYIKWAIFNQISGKIKTILSIQLVLFAVKKLTPEQKPGFCSAVGEKLWLAPGYRPEYVCRFHKTIRIKGLSIRYDFQYNMSLWKSKYFSHRTGCVSSEITSSRQFYQQPEHWNQDILWWSKKTYCTCWAKVNCWF